MKGVSLLEIIVVIALIATLSTIGTSSFINLKNDAEIDSVADELISDIRLARSKSMNGELLEGEEESEFTSENYNLPEYGISTSIDSYQILRRKCLIDDETNCETESLETVQYTDDFRERDISDRYILELTGEFFFERITGNTTNQTLIIKEINDNYGREINISNDFVITINEI